MRWDGSCQNQVDVLPFSFCRLFFTAQYFPQYADIGTRINHCTEVVGVGALNHSFLAEQYFLFFEQIDVLYALLLQRLVSLAQACIGRKI